MQDTGKICIFYQLFKSDFYANSAESDCFGRIADAEHGNPLAGDETLFPQSLQRIGAPVIFGNHAQARRAAIHGVELAVKGEAFGHKSVVKNGLYFKRYAAKTKGHEVFGFLSLHLRV